MQCAAHYSLQYQPTTHAATRWNHTRSVCNSNTLQLMSPSGNADFLSAEGDAKDWVWKAVRRGIAPAFAPRALRCMTTSTAWNNASVAHQCSQAQEYNETLHGHAAGSSCQKLDRCILRILDSLLSQRGV